MSEDQEKKDEEKFEFTAEGEALGYITLAQAGLLAMQTARAAPGNYGRRYRSVSMAFDIAESVEDEDFYNITLSFRPEGAFTGTPGQEQFFVTKEGGVALRQVLGPPNARGSWSLPLAFALEGDTEKALDKFDEAILLNPEHASAYYGRGNIYRKFRYYLRAIYDYDEAILLDPEYVSAYSRRGSSYSLLGQHRRAIQDFEEAIRLDPQYSKAYNNRGNAYACLGQYQQALEDHYKAVNLEPSALRHTNRGNSYRNLGQTETSIEDYNEAIRLDPQYAPAYAGRAKAQTLLGKDAEAEQDVEKAVELGFDRSSLEEEIQELKSQR